MPVLRWAVCWYLSVGSLHEWLMLTDLIGLANACLHVHIGMKIAKVHTGCVSVDLWSPLLSYFSGFLRAMDCVFSSRLPHPIARTEPHAGKRRIKMSTGNFAGSWPWHLLTVLSVPRSWFAIMQRWDWPGLQYPTGLCLSGLHRIDWTDLKFESEAPGPQLIAFKTIDSSFANHKTFPIIKGKTENIWNRGIFSIFLIKTGEKWKQIRNWKNGTQGNVSVFLEIEGRGLWLLCLQKGSSHFIDVGNRVAQACLVSVQVVVCVCLRSSNVEQIKSMSFPFGAIIFTFKFNYLTNIWTFMYWISLVHWN